jgi:hypothetical protein
MLCKGRVIALAVVAGLPQLRSGLEPRTNDVGFVVNNVELGQGSSEYFGFPYQLFHRLLHTHHSLLPWAGTIDLKVADIASGSSLI